MSFAK